MGWLDAFTGAAAKNASGAMMGALDQGWNNAGGALSWGGDNARGQYLDNAIPTLQSGYGDAMNALRGAYGRASGFAQNAVDTWQPYTQLGARGAETYADAAGVNGPEGNARAVSSFQAGPGYEWARGQGLDAINRTASARGQLAGGNTTADLLKYSTGLADQTWGNYMQRLNPFLTMYGTGTAGLAGAQGNQAEMGMRQGQLEAGNYTGGANAIAGQYGNVANSYTNEGNTRAKMLMDLAEQMGQAQAGGIMGAANAQGQTINAGLGLVGKLAGGFFPGFK